MVTLLDIAKNLNLNKTTVSKALNHSSDISRETRERVWEEARRLGYIKPQRKKHQQNAMIGVICPDVNGPHYSQLVTSLSQQLRTKGYGMILMLSTFSEDSEALEDALLLQLSQLNVAGIIFITERTSESPIFRSISVPLVIIGLNYESDVHDVVSIEERRGIRSIVEHLVEQGHRRVAFIGNRDVLPRLEYLREYMTAAGLPLPPEYVVMNDLGGEISGYAAAQTLLSLPVLPTAVVAGFDAMALTAYRAFTEHGLRIPEDISLVGFDNAWFCCYLPISLTSVDYDVTAECRVAIAILLDRIQQNSSQAVQAVTIVPKLIVRESSTLRK